MQQKEKEKSQKQKKPEHVQRSRGGYGGCSPLPLKLRNWARYATPLGWAPRAPQNFVFPSPPISISGAATAYSDPAASPGFFSGRGVQIQKWTQKFEILIRNSQRQTKIWKFHKCLSSPTCWSFGGILDPTATSLRPYGQPFPNGSSIFGLAFHTKTSQFCVELKKKSFDFHKVFHKIWKQIFQTKIRKICSDILKPSAHWNRKVSNWTKKCFSLRKTIFCARRNFDDPSLKGQTL